VKFGNKKKNLRPSKLAKRGGLEKKKKPKNGGTPIRRGKGQKDTGSPFHMIWQPSKNPQGKKNGVNIEKNSARGRFAWASGEGSAPTGKKWKLGGVKEVRVGVLLVLAECAATV